MREQVFDGFLRDLRLVSTGRVKVLRDINLHILPGETVFITGPNGSGKSTLLKIIAGSLKPSLGLVKVKAEPGHLLKLPGGYAESLSLRDYLFKLGFSPRKTREVLLFAELESLSEVPISELSLGMKAKLVSSYLGHSGHEIILLDDVFFTSDQEFQKRFLELVDDKTLVFANHDDRVFGGLPGRKILLYNGSIDEKG
jgi:ABC-type polysaccharide/polyol phosphate transport system ATPase subunit